MRANRVLKLAVAYTLAAASSMAMAQTPPADTATPEQLETVIVTGSYIRGSAEDAALPVDVITADDLAKQGSPSTLEILKQMPVSAGVLGDSNQFDARAQGSEGSGSVNLRGLGPQRTLVLMNGRRMVNSPFTGAPDTNLLPTSAIGRLEVLKDGAAATYGSDAIAGVVNFITKTGKTSPGLEVAADYKAIKGSDGDYTAAATFGWSSDALDFLVSGGYQHRSELLANERSWATRPYMENPQGGWSAAGNPASFVPTNAAFTPIAATFRDPQCMPLGGFNGFVQDQVTNAITPVCNWQYTQFDALTEKEDRYQVYGEVNVEFTDSLKLHVEGLYAATEIPIYRTSPSYAALQAPSSFANGGTSPVQGRYVVPGGLGGNPGFNAFNAANPGVLGAAAGAWVVAYRPFAIGGNPLFNYGSSEGPRSYDAMRFSADVKGSIGSILDFDVAATYMKQSNDREGRDTVVNRAQLALRGFGGPNCNVALNTPGVGPCSWLNPFSTAIPANAISGVANSQFVSNGVPNNNLEMIDWMFPIVSTTQSNELMVFDAVVNGEIGFFSLPGGNIGWAAGAQYRDTKFQSEYNDMSNYAITPCVNSVATGIVGPGACTAAELAAPGGALMFLGGGNNTHLQQDVYGVFGEVSLPITDSLQAQLAVRYEDYGGVTGDTVDPKLAVKWSLTDAFALRGSVGTTFRGPTANNISSGSVTSLQSVRGTFRAIRTSGNPDLSPESAFTFNVGMLLNTGPVSASLDYWSFSFKDQIVTEPVAGIVDTVFPLGGAPQCSSPLAARFTFTVAGCSVSNVTRLDIKTINGPDLDTSGIDLSLNLDLGAGLEMGVNATYVLEYQSGSLAIDGVPDVQKAFDAAGLLNYQTTAYPLPKFKGTFFAQYSKGDHTLRWQVNYVDSYTDQRTDIFLPSAATNIGGAGSNLGSAYNVANNVPVNGGKVIGSTTLHSLYYNLQLPADVTLSFALENIFDTAPSLARLDYSYDPFTGSAFGRTAKLGLKAKF